MVDQTQRLSRYRELIQELNETKKMEIARRTVELFFSFDIVNSSLYKTINYTGWYNVIICGFNLLKILPTKSREKKSTMFLEIQILGKGASTNEN